MCEEYVGRPLYLLIVNWMVAKDRWVTAKGISHHFDIEHCRAVNTLSYTLSEVGEIVYGVKIIPNQIAGRGCQCQRLVRVISVDSHLYSRLNRNLQERKVNMTKTPRLSAVPSTELDREQKWQIMLSKGMHH